MWVLLVMTGLVLIAGWRWQRSGRVFIEFVGRAMLRLYASLWFRCSNSHLSPFPMKGPAVLASNHTCSPDPLFLTVSIPRLICFLFAEEYYRAPLAWWFFDYLHCVPVKRNGKDVAAVRAALRRLEDGLVVCIFPEGGLRNAGRRVLRNGKAGAALLALRGGCPVYPVAIRGGPQTSNVARAWLMPLSKPVQVVVGTPVDLSEYRGQPLTRGLLEEANRKIMAAIAHLEHVQNAKV